MAKNIFPDHASGARPRRIVAGRVGLYVFLVVSAVVFLFPLYVMVATSLKSMDEVRQGSIFTWPVYPSIEAWKTAWFSACTGLSCDGVQAGFLNSIKILIPSTLLPIALGSVTGYALSFWRPKGGNILFGGLLLGMFVPYQVFIYPLVRSLATVGLYGNLGGIVAVHTIFAMPIMILLFRNYYAALPLDLFKAARVDGGNFWTIFWRLMLPMSAPIIIVAVILQVTGVWNDFLFGLIFAGRDNLPMTVQLNNIVNTARGAKEYNVHMAATILTAMLPLLVYLFSGRWFVRGIASGAVKG
ncbi:carbohydrate ABC transporter permease [Rhizobium sp. Root1204]|uniref:carbohydrate ABC transporter permease n=1 Tax=Rhizobium sp. Root1204 TaxID=1736428 RepID=UPI000714BD02|nr:carbohydrate ABC transporter permease [Rhizobium sp. Root1204]KQV41293.1 sugar ABC transporter permease [Rhizobium sp. Root1204]